jgi:FkbM family methyltransferase
MKGATGNIYLGLHDFADMMLVLHFLREGDLFMDIGANVGSYTVLASGVCGATTWAFEPDPRSAGSLKRNIEINNLEQFATVYECALGDTESEVPFTVGLDTSNRVLSCRGKNVRMVNQRRLDSLIGGGPHPVMMVKIDVEGYEENVIRGAQLLLSDYHCKVIVIEWPSESLIELLNSHQFRMAYYEPFSRTLQLEDKNNLSPSNQIFVRDWEFVSYRLTTANHITVLGRSI